MPGERWPDKRARAVLVAGANRLAREGAQVDADCVADVGLAVRERLFVTADVREENADPKLHRIGYSADCMQFATLEPVAGGVSLGLWLGGAGAEEARAALAARDDPNAFRRLYGWVRIEVGSADEAERLAPWVQRAAQHAARTKEEQQTGARGTTRAV